LLLVCCISLIIQEIKIKNILFASCDGKYFLDHAEAFVVSAVKQGEIPYIHCQDDNEIVRTIAASLKMKFPEFKFFHMNYRGKYPNAQKRSIYAIGRFMFAKQLAHHNMLILDIDSYIRKPIDWSDFAKMDYSLFFRDSLPGTIGWEKEGTRVAAGAVYVSHRSKLIEKTMDFINIYPTLPWFVDQVSLYAAHEKLKDEENYCQMPQKYIDWDFKDDSTIWTGKGSRKNSERYLSEKSTYLTTKT
jgi:hypothetical protein